jgi:DNA-directed RNA polymerase subunit beta
MELMTKIAYPKGYDEELIELLWTSIRPGSPFHHQHHRQEPEWDLKMATDVAEAALLEFFRKMRPGDPATLDNARGFSRNRFLTQSAMTCERVGRYKLNQKFDLTAKFRAPIAR